MASHEELVAEMTNIDRMQMNERLKLARKRRAQQLKQFAAYEKQLSKDVSRSKKNSAPASGLNGVVRQPRSRRLRFADSVLLLDATIRNDIEEVKSLLNSGVSPDTANVDGLTALHQCCIDDLEDVLRVLIERGANVNARDTEMWTPLHAAATCGHVRLCRYLCEHGADLLAVNADGNMPYDLCEDVATLDYIESEMAKRGITQELIDETRLTSENAMLADMQNIVNEGGNLESRGPAGETPLHVAACSGFASVVEFLLSHHVAIDAADCDDWRPIHCASCWGQYLVMEILLEHGADVETKTRTGETALDLCEDVEMKHRILELISEIRNKRSNRLRLQDPSSSSRRNSSSRRGSMVNPTSHGLCIRRSSLHERASLSVKDAREEAIKLRESISSLNEDDDDDERILDAITITPAQSTSDGRTSMNDESAPPSQKIILVVSAPPEDDDSPSTATPLTNGLERPSSSSGGDQRHSSAPSNRSSTLASSRLGSSSFSPTPLPQQPSSSIRKPAQTTGVPPVGTLSDLKKQRSKRLQEQLLGRAQNGDGIEKVVPTFDGGSDSADDCRSPLSVAEIYGHHPSSKVSKNGSCRDDGCCVVT